MIGREQLDDRRGFTVAAQCDQDAIGPPFHDAGVSGTRVLLSIHTLWIKFCAPLEMPSDAWHGRGMFPALTPSARVTAGLIALLAAASVVARYAYDLGSGAESPGETIWDLARFFTLLTNTLVAITFAVAAFRRDGIGAPWGAALTLAIVLVGAVYHILLAGLVEFTGLGWWADQGLHTAVPIACLFWWLTFAPKRTLHYVDLPMFVMWPCVYVAYALARGASDGIYPYPFMNLNTLGPAEVATNLVGLVITLLIGGVIFVMIGRFADR
jgi:hypothetical protein